MKVKIVNKSPFSLPEYQTELSAGLDLRAVLEDGVRLAPLERKLVATGLYIELPAGFEAQIRPRSGMAFKQGITVLNSPGTIDADYRGELKVLLVNLSNQEVVIEHGDRVAQMVIAKHEKIEWVESEALTETKRGEGGYGSTGKK
ncbi:dUTP diphosphatase [Imperialibacter roseus]|uniref:Deoxyuridine 5'-triphosphate nucleotidohydrolase n=1 Tax=Imperialibacter roseus TaxID=1324217 RepID=A0ABZ0IKJ7_9BACT|nr:dUTP diphosphatase [Imperialibacter roseus]WOK05539.1 dUTP diphosphatase [Imperialibacter roseus]